MQSFEALNQEFVASFALQRQRLVFHASSVLSSNEAVDGQPEIVAKLSQMLVTSLEVLKVAEEELFEERRQTTIVRADLERKLTHRQAMFDLAPVPLVLTTSDTTIRESNKAASALFGLDPRTLEGKQLLRMVPKDQQAAFREQLGHAITIGAVEAWPFTIQLARSVPVVISATVHLVDDPAVGARALYWHIKPTAV